MGDRRNAKYAFDPNCFLFCLILFPRRMIFVASVGGDGEGGGLVAVMRMKVMGCSWMGSGGVLEGGQTVGSELGGRGGEEEDE
ncbi:hypothetical protein Tco_0935837 [Tanacetum coccineum]